MANDTDTLSQLDAPEVDEFLSEETQPSDDLIENIPNEGIDPRQPMAEGGAVAQAPINATPAQDSGLDELDKVNLDSLDSPDVDSFLGDELKEEKYGTTGQMIKTGLEGAAQGVLGPFAPLAEKKLLGVKDEDILGRKETNPITHGAGEIAGLIGSSATGFGEGALAAKAAGALAPKALEGASIAARLGSAASKAAIENAVISAGDETSNMIINDPNTSAETALASVGLAGLLGGAIGGTLAGAGAVFHPLAKFAGDTKIGQIIEDFKGRIDQHIANPDPLEATHEELSQLYHTMSESSSDIYGPKGLKNRDILKVVPEINGSIIDQAKDVHSLVDDKIKRMIADQHSYPPRLTTKLQADLENYTKQVSKEGLTSADVFEATQELKQTMQGYAKYEKRIEPFNEAYDFVRDAKKIASDLREKLEDKKIWGKAAERQQSINGAFSKYLPTLQDFERKFTTEINGERVIDKGKLQTYINQFDKASGAAKKDILNNFIEASDKYHGVIADTHANLGLDAPMEYGSLHHTKSTLQKQTTGGRLADIFIDKGLTDAGSKGLGAAAGAGVGSTVGAPVMGALVGSHVLGPFFKSVLPAIVKPMLETANSSVGLKTAIDYGLAVVKGQTALNRAAKAVFTPTKDVLVNQLSRETDRGREKLNKQLEDIQRMPAKLMDSASNNTLNHYMPAHNSAMATTQGNAVAYLNSLRPRTDKQSPLDSPRIPSNTEKVAYNHALDIAQNPIMVLDKVKNGSITPQDIKTLNAVAPALYASMRQQVMTEMTNHLSKDGQVPYKTRIGVSLFLGQPMDSTMTPSSIVAAQMSGQVAKSQQQSQQPVSQTPKHSTAALSKLPNQLLTASQAREQRSNKV